MSYFWLKKNIDDAKYYASHFRLYILFEGLVLADGERFFRSVFFVGKL